MHNVCIWLLHVLYLQLCRNIHNAYIPYHKAYFYWEEIGGGGLVLILREPHQGCICARASVLYTSFTPDLLQVVSIYGLGDRSRGTPGIYPIATATTTSRPPLCRIILPLVSFLSVLSRCSTGGFRGHWYESEPMMGSMSRVSDSHIALRI